MAEEIVKKVKIEVDNADAVKEIEEIKNSLKETNKTLNDSKKANEASAESTKTLAKGFTGIGLAIKAAGIGLILGLLSTLKDLLMGNEKVAKAMATVFNFLQIVMNEVVEVISDVVTKMTDMWKSMDSTKAVIGGLIKIAFTPLKLIFQEISLYIKVLQLAWEKSIFGKGDPGRIKELTTDIKQIGTNIKQIAIDAVKAGKDVVVNFGGAMKEIGEAGKEAYNIVSKAAKDFSVANAIALAKAKTDAEKNFGLIAIAAQNEIDKLEAIAEKQRQVRDDITKSYDERQKASSDLLLTLDKELLAMLKLASAHVKQAQIDYEANKNTQTLLALKTAELEVDKAKADIEGKKSEQLAATNALTKESIDLQKQLTEGQLTDLRAIEDFKNSRVIDDKNRIENQIALENKRLDQDLQNIQKTIDESEKGTAEYTNALIQKSKLETDYYIKIGQLEDDLEYTKKTYAENEKARNTNYAKAFIDNLINLRDKENTTFKTKIALNNEILAQQEKIAEAAAKEEEAQRLKNEALISAGLEVGEIEKQRLLDLQNIANAELAIKIKLYDDQKRLVEENTKMQLDAAANIVSQLQSIDQAATDALIGNEQRKLKEKKISQEEYDKNVDKIQQKAAKREKAYAISAAIISTAQAIVGFLAAKPIGPWNWVQAAAAGVLGAAQIAKIIATPISSTSGGGGSGVSAPSTTTEAPNTSFSFSPTVATPVTEQQPIKTYVLSKDVSTNAQLERAVIANGSI